MTDEQVEFLANHLNESERTIRFEYQKDPFYTKFYEAILKDANLM